VHGRHALVVLRVDVSTRSQEHLDDLDVAVLCGYEQGRVAEFIADIDGDAKGEDGGNFFVSAVARAGEEQAQSVG
jgi:hypothetical protein